MSAKRLFVSLELPGSVAGPLARLDPKVPGVRWIVPANLHLTLAFLGQVEAAAEVTLRDRLSAIRFSSFFLPLTGIDAFPGKGRPRVIWLGVGRGHPHLFQLHQRVTDAALAAGLAPDLRPWHPHVTLARCDNVTAQSLGPFLVAQGDGNFGLVPIDSFQLKSSRPTPAGSVYTTELVVPAA